MKCDVPHLTVICSAANDPLRNEFLRTRNRHRAHVIIMKMQPAYYMIGIFAFTPRLKFVPRSCDSRIGDVTTCARGHQEARIVIRVICQNRWRGMRLLKTPPTHLRLARDAPSRREHNDDMRLALLSAPTFPYIVGHSYLSRRFAVAYSILSSSSSLSPTLVENA